MLLTVQQSDALRFACKSVCDSVPPGGDRSARDWSAFFSALVVLIKEILPLVVPIFLEPKSE